MRSAILAALALAASSGSYFGRDSITVASTPGATGSGKKGEKARKKARAKAASASKRRNRK